MESIHTKVMQLIFFLFIMTAIVCLRLFFLQIIHHDYYFEKTHKQRKKIKDPLYSRKYKIFAHTSVFDIEIIPKQLLNKQKRIQYNSSIDRLAKLMGYEKEFVWKKCQKKYQYLRNKIDAKVKDEYAKNGGDWNKIMQEEEEEYFNKPYPLFYDVDKKIIMKLEMAKHTWTIINDKLKKQDLYTGFVIRRRAKQPKSGIK